jgi:hypothetical protein
MIAYPQPCLPAVPTHPARAALTRHRIDRDRLIDRRPRRPDLPSQVEHPGPQLLGILDAMPRTVAQDDEAMRRANPQLLLRQHEVNAHLCPMPRP